MELHWTQLSTSKQDRGVKETERMMDNIIASCEKNAVKRLIVTGSYTNMTGNGKGDKSHFNEKDFAAPESMYGHMRSKRK